MILRGRRPDIRKETVHEHTLCARGAAASQLLPGLGRRSAARAPSIRGESLSVLRAIVAREGLTLKSILVTHGHFDHVDGVHGLAEATGARVYCSASVAPVLAGAEGCSATGYPIPAIDAETIEIVERGHRADGGGLGRHGHRHPRPHAGRPHLRDRRTPLLRRPAVLSLGRPHRFPRGRLRRSSLHRSPSWSSRYPDSTPVHPGHMQSTTLGDELAHNPFLGGLKSDG